MGRTRAGGWVLARKTGSDEGVVDRMGPRPTAGILTGGGGTRRHGGGAGATGRRPRRTPGALPWAAGDPSPAHASSWTPCSRARRSHVLRLPVAQAVVISHHSPGAGPVRTAPRGKSPHGTDGLPMQVPGRAPPEGHKPALRLLLEVQGSLWMMDSWAVLAGHRGMPAMTTLAMRGRKGSHPHPRHSRARARLGDPKRPQWPQRPLRPRKQRPTTGQLFPPLPPDAQRTKPEWPTPAPLRLHLGQRHHLLAAPGSLGHPDTAESQTERTERTRTGEPRPQPASERLVHGPRGKASRGLAGMGISATPATSAKGFGTLQGEVPSMF